MNKQPTKTYSTIIKFALYFIIFATIINIIDSLIFLSISNETFNQVAFSGVNAMNFGLANSINVTGLKFSEVKNADIKIYYNFYIIGITIFQAIMSYAVLLILNLLKNIKDTSYKISETLIKNISLCFIIYSFYPTVGKLTDYLLVKNLNVTGSYLAPDPAMGVNLLFIGVDAAILLLVLCMNLMYKIFQKNINSQNN